MQSLWLLCDWYTIHYHVHYDGIHFSECILYDDAFLNCSINRQGCSRSIRLRGVAIKSVKKTNNTIFFVGNSNYWCKLNIELVFLGVISTQQIICTVHKTLYICPSAPYVHQFEAYVIFKKCSPFLKKLLKTQSNILKNLFLPKVIVLNTLSYVRTKK